MAHPAAPTKPAHAAPPAPPAKAALALALLCASAASAAAPAANTTTSATPAASATPSAQNTQASANDQPPHPCPPGAPEPPQALPATPAALQAALAQHLGAEAHCAADAAFLLRLGRLLNHARRYPEALPRLESALLLRPGHAPTLLEFALALAGSGEPQAAYLALQEIQPGTDTASTHANAEAGTSPADSAATPTPAELAHLRHTLHQAAQAQAAQAQAQQAQPTQPQAATPASPARRSLNLALGWDSNLSATPRHPQVELTLPTGPVWVQLQTSPERAGLTLQADFEQSAPLAARWHYRLHASARSAWATWASDTTASAAHPSPHGNTHPTRLHWGGALAWHPSLAQNTPNAGHWVIEAAHQGIALDGRALYLQTGLTASYSFQPAPTQPQPAPAPAPCTHTLGLEAQLRRYPQLPVLDGHYLGVLWRAHCSTTGLQAQLRLGQDHPTHPQRPGGAQRSLGLRLSWQQNPNPSSSPHPSSSPAAQPALPQPPGWFALADLAWLHDAHGYSPWLAHGQPRTQQRALLRLEYRWPHPWPARGWQPYAWADSFTQRSNLALFEMQQHTLGLGLRRSW